MSGAETEREMEAIGCSGMNVGEINQSSSVANVKRMLVVKLYHKHQLITTWVLRSQLWQLLTTSHQHGDAAATNCDGSDRMDLST